ncbi:sulfotransferase family protein [Mycolicibacterium novocastrense]|nr:sulfotransferase family protein [Mycolicibacterium novocastrense]
MTSEALYGGHERRPTAVFVLGMARSGTSALTRVISLCGGALPPGMVGGFVGNPRGYWEPRKAVHINETILRRHGSAGFDPSLRLQEAGALDAGTRSTYVARIRAYFTTLPRAPFVVIKHPMIAALWDLWFEAARSAGFNVVAVIAVRHPQESIASFRSVGGKLNAGASPELAGALWLKYNLLSERQTRGLPRVFVEYSNLLDDWRREVKRMSAALPVDLDVRDEVAIDDYLELDLRHERHTGKVMDLFGTDWLSTVYETLAAAARDEPWDESVLDGVFEAYRATESGFRAAHGDFQRVYKIHRFAPAMFGRLSSELLAIAHRRKGTWA